MHPSLVLILGGLYLVQARLLHSPPDDTYAFPKFKTVFYNDLPLLNDIAEEWMQHGIAGGLNEFLDLPWQATQQASIDASQSEQRDAASNHSLEHMRLGPLKSFLCLVPSPTESDTSPSIEEQVEIEEPSAAQSWSLLQPLAEKCLYLRNHWFTYSYCHNKEVRQFHELPQTSPSNAYMVQEDINEDAYSLGRAPKTESGSDLSTTQVAGAELQNVELAKGVGSRYLVQRWGDGTLCDKTGEPRDIEIQYHCSMAQSDSILFVREARTCSYVIVINTPRLCGQPGFKSTLESREETPIRCREVVDALPLDKPTSLHESDFPPNAAPQRKQLPAETLIPKATNGYNDIIKQALEKIMGKSKLSSDQQLLFEISGRNGEKEEMVVEVMHPAETDPDGVKVEWVTDKADAKSLSSALIDKLRAAGFEIHSEKKKAEVEEEEHPGP